MTKKRRTGNDKDQFVYSTNPDFSFNNDDNREEATLPAQQQKLRLTLDTKQRAGKAVTLLHGFVGSTEDLQTLGKQLKTLCGTGGSVKEGIVIIQGDHRDKLLTWLLKNGYQHTRRG